MVLAVHGIRGGPGVAAEHARALGAMGRFASVAVGCHKGAPDLIGAVGAAAARGPVVVVPLLLAVGYTLRAIQKKLDRELAPSQRPAVTDPISVHPRFADLIANQALLGCRRRNWSPRTSALLLVGHGTRCDPTSGDTTRRHAGTARASGRFREVEIAFLDEPPSVHEALARIDASQVVVVGLFLDRGEHGERDIPRLLRPGTRAIYTGPVGVDPLVPELVLDQLRALDASAAA